MKLSRFVTLTMLAALIVVPLTEITGNFHNIFSYAQTANTTAQTAKQDSLNNTFHSAFDTFVVPGSVDG